MFFKNQINPLKAETRQGCPLSPYLFSSSQSNERTKGDHGDTKQKEVKILLSANDDSIHKQPQKFYQGTPIADKKLSANWLDTRLTQKSKISVALLYTNDK